ncbi:MAG: hypothetical protein E7560_06115 [Ruminococcaceae bacterium]|nr:hypothetical protein [Oscillospiraceae bacterium]
MFLKGEIVVYGQSGVCKIEDICEKELIRNQKKRYYVLKPIFQPNNVIYAPFENNKVFMRKVITKTEAEALILKIPQIIDALPESEVATEEYKKQISNYECADLIKLTSQIYSKRLLARSQKKKLGFLDEKYMSQAENLLFGEFSVALGIPFDEVQKYIEEKIK